MDPDTPNQAGRQQGVITLDIRFVPSEGLWQVVDRHYYEVTDLHNGSRERIFATYYTQVEAVAYAHGYQQGKWESKS
jgi:hypothetical protein